MNRVYCSGTTQRGAPCCKSQDAAASSGKGGWIKVDDVTWFCEQHRKQLRRWAIHPAAQQVTVTVNGVSVTVGVS